MAFWLSSLLPSVHPQLQTFTQELQIRSVQAQTPRAEHVRAQKTRQDPWSSQPLHASSVHGSLFCHCTHKSELSGKVVWFMPLLCSGARYRWDLPGRCFTCSQTLPVMETHALQRQTISILKYHCSYKAYPMPTPSLTRHTLSPTLPAVFPVMISGSLPCFWNRRGQKENMQPERCSGKEETLPGGLAEQR